MSFTIHRFPKIDSTNDYLKSLEDAPEFTCIVADEQTAGRGRYSRSWHSTPGDGLYLSILFRPKESSEKISLISLLAAIAVAETLIELGLAGVDIKWPNDVLINDRKVCGILVEGASVGASPPRLILGIGVNLNHRSFPDRLAETATSVWMETGKRTRIDEFLKLLLARIQDWHETFASGDLQAIVARWESLSTYARAKQVAVALDDEQIFGVTDGLTPAGALRVIDANGEARVILAGEIMNLRKKS